MRFLPAIQLNRAASAGQSMKVISTTIPVDATIEGMLTTTRRGTSALGLSCPVELQETVSVIDAVVQLGGVNGTPQSCVSKANPKRVGGARNRISQL